MEQLLSQACSSDTKFDGAAALSGQPSVREKQGEGLAVRRICGAAEGRRPRGLAQPLLLCYAPLLTSAQATAECAVSRASDAIENIGKIAEQASELDLSANPLDSLSTLADHGACAESHDNPRSGWLPVSAGIGY